MGNIVGSSISNILGAFSLGLVFHRSGGEGVVFDRSARIYSLLLLVLTALVTLIAFFGTRGNWKVWGVVLLLAFVGYVVSVGLAIGRGVIAAPEGSDSESDEDEGSEVSDDERQPLIGERTNGGRTCQNEGVASGENSVNGTLAASLAPERISRPPRRRPRSLAYHVAFLLLGFVCICMSGYVLSYTSSTISDEIGISDVLFGVVILSIATTLPEKFIAVLSGYRGYGGILVANTVGSNIFLLTLCLGILLVATAGDFDAGSVNAVELGVMMGSTVALTATVWFGARWSRWIGAAMLIAYVTFLVLEFTVIR